MTHTYTKLFSSIVSSSIWGEPQETKIVWITLLAMADQHGEIQASLPGLARLAVVPLVDVEAAIAALLAPDEHSRTEAYEGRRIEKIDGGWLLLNHAKYRAIASTEHTKEQSRIRQQRKRDRDRGVTDA